MSQKRLQVSSWSGANRRPIFFSWFLFAIASGIAFPTTGVAQFDHVINVPPDPPPTRLDEQTQLNVTGTEFADDGSNDGIFDIGAGSEVNLSNAGIRNILKATNTIINMTGTGSQLDWASLSEGSVLNMEAGVINNSLMLTASSANILGGEVNSLSAAMGRPPFGEDGPATIVGSDVFIDGGATLENVMLEGTSTLTVNSGTIGQMEAVGLSIPLTMKIDPVVLRINDGTFGDVTVRLGIAEIHGGSFEQLHVSSKSSVSIYEGTSIDRFTASNLDSLNIYGGIITEIPALDVRGPATLSGGWVGGNVFFYNTSQVVMSGGTIDGNLRIPSDSDIAISGGTITDNFVARGTHITINISGGSIDGFFYTERASHVNFVGHNFYLNGVPVEGLGSGPLTITDRDVTLSGRLADGTPFSYELNSTTEPIGREGLNVKADYFSRDVTLTISLVPEPATLGVFLTALAGVSFWRLARRPDAVR